MVLAGLATENRADLAIPCTGWIVKGVPEQFGHQMLNVQIHPSCHPMDLTSIQRQTDAEGLDYFEVSITFTEIGYD